MLRGVHEVWTNPLLAEPVQQTGVDLHVFWTATAPPRTPTGICWQSRPMAPSRTSLKARPRPASASWACLPCFCSCAIVSIREKEAGQIAESKEKNKREANATLTICEQHWAWPTAHWPLPFCSEEVGRAEATAARVATAAKMVLNCILKVCKGVKLKS